MRVPAGLRGLFLVWGVGLLLGLPRVAAAATGDGGGQVYKVTITTIEISDDGGSTFTTIFSGSQEIDVAAVDAGAIAAGLVSGVDLADGTYNAIRATVADTIQVKGYVNISGTTHYTDGGTDAAAFSQAAGNDNPPSDSTFAESTFGLGGPQSQTTTGLSIVMSPETSPVVTVAFNTADVVFNDGGNPSVRAPTVTITTR